MGHFSFAQLAWVDAFVLLLCSVFDSAQTAIRTGKETEKQQQRHRVCKCNMQQQTLLHTEY